MKPWMPNGPRRGASGFLVPSGATLGPIIHRGEEPVQLGLGVQTPKVHVMGSLSISANCKVAAVICGAAVTIGANCTIDSIRAEGSITVQAGSRIGDVVSGADVILLGNCHVGNVAARGDIVISGAPKTGKLSPGGRLATR